MLDLPFEARRPASAPAAGIRHPAELLRTIGAWHLLVLCDLALRLRGFDGLFRLVGRWGASDRASDVDPVMRTERIRATCVAVDRACTFYFKHAWCLQRSAAAVCYLRLRGVDAQLVIGVRKIPFSAHAWAEVDEKVVNDRRGHTVGYREIARC
jgi:hypothetical protein